MVDDRLTLSAPAAAIGDLAELLDVHMDQFARAGLLVAVCGGSRGPDHLAGHRVTLGQPRYLVAGQDPRHRPRWDAQCLGDAVAAAALGAADLEHLLFDLRRGLGWGRARTRGPVMQAGFPLGVVPDDPGPHA